MNPCQSIEDTLACPVMQKLFCAVACVVYDCRTEQVLNQKQSKKPEVTWHIFQFLCQMKRIDGKIEINTIYIVNFFVIWDLDAPSKFLVRI